MLYNVIMKNPLAIWMYVMKYIGLAVAVYYIVWFFLVSKTATSVQKTEEMIKMDKNLSFFNVTILLFGVYAIIVFMKYPNWFNTNIMNHSREVNFIKVYFIIFFAELTLVKWSRELVISNQKVSSRLSE